MKLAMIDNGRGARPAALLTDGRLLDLAAAFSGADRGNVVPNTVTGILVALQTDSTIKDLVAAVEAGSDRADAVPASAFLDSDAVHLLPPVEPRLILCTGGGYADHIREMGAEAPKAAGGFIKSLHAVVGPHDPIVLPPAAPTMVDYECELACVFARPCYNLPPDEALACIGGYTMINDVSARDDVAGHVAATAAQDLKATANHWDRIVLGKQFPTFCPIGPVVTTSDELRDPHNVTVRTLLNGEEMQSAHTSTIVFNIAETISRFSKWHAFAPGDVISTGSPAGVGIARKPPVFLREGDVVEVSGSGIGSLINRVVAA